MLFDLTLANTIAVESVGHVCLLIHGKMIPRKAMKTRGLILVNFPFGKIASLHSFQTIVQISLIFILLHQRQEGVLQAALSSPYLLHLASGLDDQAHERTGLSLAAQLDEQSIILLL